MCVDAVVYSSSIDRFAVDGAEWCLLPLPLTVGLSCLDLFSLCSLSLLCLTWSSVFVVLISSYLCLCLSWVTETGRGTYPKRLASQKGERGVHPDNKRVRRQNQRHDAAHSYEGPTGHGGRGKGESKT